MATEAAVTVVATEVVATEVAVMVGTAISVTLITRSGQSRRDRLRQSPFQAHRFRNNPE